MTERDLSSWKEIAEFLGVSVRTAQLWEKQRGLPVRRVPGGQKSSVRAGADELRQWLAGMPPEPEPAATSIGKSRVRWILLGLTAGLAAVAAWVVHAGSNRAIAKAEMHGNTLVALDEQNRPVWTHAFGETPLSPQPHENWDVYLQRVRWNRGALPEVVAGVQFKRPSGSVPQLICLDSRGKQRWLWEPAVDLLDFNGEPFEKHWAVQQVVADESGNEPVVWAAVSNPIRWASALFRIDSRGSAKLQFANAGSIMRVLRLQDGRLLAAGVNNAWARPFLAEVDPGGPPAFSPPSGPDRYHFTNGPRGQTKRYFLLPHSEIPRLYDVQYFHVSGLSVTGDRVVVETIIANRPIYLYQFDTQLRPVKVRTTASAVGTHQVLERKGLVDHPVERCPEMTTTHAIREWTPQGGWREHEVPVASAFNTR